MDELERALDSMHGRDELGGSTRASGGPLGERVSHADVRELINDVRSHTYRNVSTEGILAIAAVMRCAHLLENMIAVDGDRAGHLLTVGFRDVMETAVNGLYIMADPTSVDRFVKKDLISRRAIATALGQSQRFSELMDDFGDWDDSKNMSQFAQRVDAVHDKFPELMPDSQSELVRAMYAFLSNFAMHGGAGVLGDYLVECPGGVGMHIVPTPTPKIHPRDAISMAAAFTSQLFTVVRDAHS